MVAGRGLPQDATVRLADAAERMPRSQSPRGDRRRVRARRGFSYLLDDVLETLDHSAAVGTQERLEVVADAVCRLVDGCSWWVSRTDDSYSVLQTVSYSAIRYGGGLVADQEAVARRHVHVRRSPTTRSARRMLEGHGGVVAVDDPLADPAERAILEGAGYTALVMAGATDAVRRRLARRGVRRRHRGGRVLARLRPASLDRVRDPSAAAVPAHLRTR